MIVILASLQDELAVQLAVFSRKLNIPCAFVASISELELTVDLDSDGKSKTRLKHISTQNTVKSIVNRWISHGENDVDGIFQQCEELAAIWALLRNFEGIVVNRPCDTGLTYEPQINSLLRDGTNFLNPNQAVIARTSNTVIADICGSLLKRSGDSEINIHAYATGYYIGVFDASTALECPTSEVLRLVSFCPNLIRHILVVGDRLFDLDCEAFDLDRAVYLSIHAFVKGLHQYDIRFCMCVIQLGDKPMLIHFTQYPYLHLIRRCEHLVYKAILEYCNK